MLPRHHFLSKLVPLTDIKMKIALLFLLFGTVHPLRYILHILKNQQFNNILSHLITGVWVQAKRVGQEASLGDAGKPANKDVSSNSSDIPRVSYYYIYNIYLFSFIQINLILRIRTNVGLLEEDKATEAVIRYNNQHHPPERANLTE